jgi:hypothetical protein
MLFRLQKTPDDLVTLIIYSTVNETSCETIFPQGTAYDFNAKVLE